MGAGLVAIADDGQRPMATLEPEILELVAHASETRRPFKPRRNGQGGVVTVEPLRGKQKRAQLAAIHAVASARGDLGSTTNVLGGFAVIRPSM